MQCNLYNPRLKSCHYLQYRLLLFPFQRARNKKTPDLEEQLNEITRERIKMKDSREQLHTNLKSEKAEREDTIAICERSKEELEGRRRWQI